MGGMSLPEAKEAYEQLATSLKQLEENLKQLRAETKETLALLPAAVVPCSTEEETAEAARHFYWNCPEITSKAIKDALGWPDKPSRSLPKYVGPVIWQTACKRCGNSLNVVKDSRSGCAETEVCGICLAEDKELKYWEVSPLFTVPARYEEFTPRTLFSTYGKAIYREKKKAMEQVAAWLDGNCEKPGLILAGPSGTGKTALALAAMRWAMRRGKKRPALAVRYLTLLRILSYPDWGSEAEHELMHRSRDIPLLVIDDFGEPGLAAHQSVSALRQDLLLKILGYRADHKLPTLIVTFLTYPRLRAQFHDALVKRLEELCQWVEVGGADLRKLERGGQSEGGALQTQSQYEWATSMPYADYLQTEHWQSVRKRVLRRAGYKCQLCNDGGTLNVHHKTYENLGSERQDDLIVLCKDCHGRHHDKVNA